MKNITLLSLLILIFTVSHLQSQISTDGLLAYYPMSGNVLDMGPSGHHGNLFGGSFVEDSDGNMSNALYLDGIDDFVDLSSFAQIFKENLGEMSIYFKVKFVEESDDQTILSLGNRGENLNTNVFEIEFEHERLQVETERTSSAFNYEYPIDNPENLFTSEWIEILVLLKGDSLTYCRNGQEIYKDIYLPAETTTQTMFIGCFGGVGPLPCCFAGIEIDELQFYDRILQKLDCPTEPISEDLIIHLCEGDIETINGIDYQMAGNYVQELITSDQCDSILNIEIIIDNIIEDIVYYNGCMGDDFSYEINGNIYNESNPYGTEYVEADDGCDSIITIDLKYTFCGGCETSIPGLGLQVLKNSESDFNIYFLGEEMMELMTHEKSNIICHYVLEAASNFNKVRRPNELYQIEERFIIDFLTKMEDDTVVKF